MAVAGTAWLESVTAPTELETAAATQREALMAGSTQRQASASAPPCSGRVLCRWSASDLNRMQPSLGLPSNDPLGP